MARFMRQLNLDKGITPDSMHRGIARDPDSGSMTSRQRKEVEE